MKNLFTMTELMTHDPCEDGLTRLTNGLGTYSGPTTITIDDFGPLIPSDILWCLKLLPISDHEQKVICVKTALYAADLISHLTDDPNADICIDGAKAWLTNPCDGIAESQGWLVAEWSRGWANNEANIAADKASFVAFHKLPHVSQTAIAVDCAVSADPTTRPKIKSYLISLIEELD
jgi:hypothetical protein